MKKILLLLLLVCGFIVSANAQGWLERVGKDAVKRAKERAKWRVEQKVENAVDKVVDNPTSILETDDSDEEQPSKKNKKSDNDYADNTVITAKKNKAEVTQVKSDFVPGPIVIFEDNMQGEQVGEFPSKWDLVRGNAEVAVVGGEKCIAMDKHDCWISPYMKDGSKNYLGDVFTIEYDMLFDDSDRNGAPQIELNRKEEIMNSLPWNTT